jgi:hypothetical protein
VAVFCDTEGVGVAIEGVGVATVGDTLGDGEVGDALATDEFVVFAAAVVVALLVSELDA